MIPVLKAIGKNIYGGDGYNVINDSVSYPSYASVSVQGNSSFTWSGSTTEARALERANTGRIASTWYGNTMTINVNLTDGQNSSSGFVQSRLGFKRTGTNSRDH